MMINDDDDDQKANSGSSLKQNFVMPCDASVIGANVALIEKSTNDKQHKLLTGILSPVSFSTSFVLIFFSVSDFAEIQIDGK